MTDINKQYLLEEAILLSGANGPQSRGMTLRLEFEYLWGVQKRMNDPEEVKKYLRILQAESNKRSPNNPLVKAYEEIIQDYGK